MATRTSQLLWNALDDLRVEPVEKWVRASHGDLTVVDTRRALLVWEPRRIVGSYAVPEEDVAGELRPTTGGGADERPVSVGEVDRLLGPSTPFAAHTTPGTSLTVRTSQGELPEAAFRADDAELAGYVILDWNAFSQWYEEEQAAIGHPRDPFHRIDCMPSSRHVQIAHWGVTLADSSRAVLLFETSLPTRYYLPLEDVAMDLLEPTRTHTVCAYKGQASYWSARAGDTLLPDIAWSYPEPLNDAVPVGGRVAFLTERLDLTVDGRRQPRPRTPWS